MTADGTGSFHQHDHTACVSRGIAAAETAARARGLRFTPLRRRVLEILLEEHRAMGAYDVLARLAAEGLGTHPPVAYRALDFLVANGFAHKIERLNAFVSCSHPGQSHRPAFMICKDCSSVAEAHIAPDDGALGAAARAAGFEITRTVIEAEGTCPSCRAAAPG